MLTALVNGLIYTGTEIIKGKTVLCEDEKIKGIVEKDNIPAGADVKDCDGLFIAPGLIDLQIAGGGGYLFTADASPEALNAIAESIVSTGTTGFLLAVPTDSMQVYREVIGIIKSNPHPAVLGLHLEGPYISHVRRGAHNRNFIKIPEPNELRSLLDEAEGTIKLMTVAPEVCSPEVIRILNDHNVVVSAGHSNATYDEAIKGFDWGIQAATHLFNGMSQFHHRDPGLPGAAFACENVMAAIIADGVHVHFQTVSIAKKLMKERLFLVSDAVEEDRFSGNNMHLRKNDRFTLPDGTLSGSILSMMKAVQNCIDYAGIDTDEALRMASLYPAHLMQLKDRGMIKAGYNADLIVFNGEFAIESVFVNGKQIK